MDHLDDQRLPVVYSEMVGASMFMDDHSAVDAHLAVLAELDRVALDRGQSRSWLMKLASEYDRPGV